MWLETNESLERKVFSEIGVISSRKLEGGLVNSVYHVELKNGISGVLRVADNETEGWIPKKERAVLSRFCEFPFFPKVLSYGELRELNLSFNVLSFFEGDNMHTTKEIPNPQVFLSLGETLGKIHSYKATEFGFVYDFDNTGADPRIHNSYPGPYRNGFEQHFIPAKGWTEHLIERKSRYSRELDIIVSRMEKEKSLFTNGECTYNHGDFQFKNILVEGERLAGVLDFDSFRYGDPSTDLHMFLQNCIGVSHDLAYKFLEGYVDRRNLPDNFFAKAPFYRYYQAIQAVIAIPLHLRNTPPDRVELYKDRVKKFLQTIIEGSDPVLITKY
ncbi:MAG: aminoglycoside phosphotransferase family protein [Nanoarchaeota archaeon]